MSTGSELLTSLVAVQGTEGALQDRLGVIVGAGALADEFLVRTLALRTTDASSEASVAHSAKVSDADVQRAYLFGMRGITDPASKVDEWLNLRALEPAVEAFAYAKCTRFGAVGKFRRPPQIDFFAPSIRWMMVRGVLRGGDDRIIRLIIDWFAKHSITYVPLLDLLRVVGMSPEMVISTDAEGLQAYSASPVPKSESELEPAPATELAQLNAVSNEEGALHAVLFANDVARGRDVLLALGGEDVGQAVAVCAGEVLAIEAAEGTNAMLKRAAALRQTAASDDAGQIDYGGVVVKLPKTRQLAHIDQPCIGKDTVALAIELGFSGLAMGAGVLLLDQDEVHAMADTAHFQITIL